MIDIPSLKTLILPDNASWTPSPFPHVILRDVIDPNALHEAVRAWPADDAPWRQYQRGKRGMMEREYIPAPLLAVIDSLNSPEFVAWLSELSGISGLLADPDLQGGGLHEVLNGGSLGMHLDFNQNPQKPAWFRRLNVLLYVNETWQPEWGGVLKLRDHPLKPSVEQLVPPEFNRMVIFRSTEGSWHGHPDKLNTPPGITRRSIASYYYATESDPSYVEPHSTVYRHEDGTGTGLPRRRRKKRGKL